MSYPLALYSSRDRQAAQALIEANDLRFEPTFDDLLGVFLDGRLVACGARAGRVLKMLVVTADKRGTGLTGDIAAELMRLGREAGHNSFLIFTRRCSVTVFTGLGFKPLTEQGPIIMLEQGNRLPHYLAERAALMRPGNNVAVMIDADPFARAHARLIERTAQGADTVYVFVYGEGPYRLPLDNRLECARRSVAHIDSAVVTDLAHYHIHPRTFPTYFLRPDDDAEAIRTGIVDELFVRHIAPSFHIIRRVADLEPQEANHAH